MLCKKNWIFLFIIQPSYRNPFKKFGIYNRFLVNAKLHKSCWEISEAIELQRLHSFNTAIAKSLIASFQQPAIREDKTLPAAEY
jgi:hypothetical protein